MAQRTDVIAIGGGQAGLAISYFLTRDGRDHVVLEQDRLGETWRSKRWDSFTLVTPNWMLQLPDFPCQGNDPDGFLLREEVVEYLEGFAASFDPPLQTGVRATSLDQAPDREGYIVETTDGAFQAPNVVVCTGAYQVPKIPSIADQLPPGMPQIHTDEYENAESLPEGAVLVVGSGQSGCQIAEELNQAGREVYLCVGGSGRIPRRHRGRDTAWWLDRMGFADQTVDMLPSPEMQFSSSNHLTGKDGGRDLNLHQFARDGIVLLGRLEGAEGEGIYLADDLKEKLARADAFAAQIRQRIDGFIEKTGMEAPELEAGPELDDGFHAPAIRDLDIQEARIATVIWTTGYTLDYRWVEVPTFDENGYPIHTRGVTEHPGLYFLGLNWLHTLKSGLIVGVGEDAAHLAEKIASR